MRDSWWLESALALIGSGSVDVTATQSGDTYRTRVAVGVSLSSLMLGNTLPRGASVAQATLTAVQ